MLSTSTTYGTTLPSEGVVKSLFGTLRETGSNVDAHQNTLPLAVCFPYKMSHAQLPFPIPLWVIISMLRPCSLKTILTIVAI